MRLYHQQCLSNYRYLAYECNLKFADQSETVMFAIGTPFIFSCAQTLEERRCTDVLNTTWLLNGTKLVESHRVRIYRWTNTVVVTYGTTNDVGKYMCLIDNNGSISKRTFNLVVTDPTPMQKVLLQNVLPPNETDVKEGNIYWMPDMLHRDANKNQLLFPWEDIRLRALFYIASKNVDKKKVLVTWDYLMNDTKDLHMESDEKMANSVRQNPCSDWYYLFVTKPLSGSCFRAELDVKDSNIAYQGDYRMAINVSHSGKTQLLNLTYSVSINSHREHHDELREFVEMNFTKDVKVCLHSSIEFLCTFKSYWYYIAEIIRGRHVNYQVKVLKTTESKNSKFNKFKVYGMVPSVTRSSLKHTIRNVTHWDAGRFFCISRPPEKLTPIEYMGITVWNGMELTVIDCTGKKKEFRIIVSLLVLFFIMIVSVILLRWYYTSSYLIKRVSVQPQKVYISYGNLPLLVFQPDISIKTIRKFKTILIDCFSYKKVMKYPSISFHEMSSRIMENDCVFNSDDVDDAGSSPNVKIVPYVNNEMTNISPDDRRNDGRFHVVIKNKNQTKYFLSSNIFRMFAREDLTISTKIGEGAFGIVYNGLVRSGRSTPLEVAVKTLQDSVDDLVNLFQEFEMMKIIGRHPYIVSLYGACFDEEHFFLIMELAKYGNLKNFLRFSRCRNDIKETCSSSDEFVPLFQQGDLMKFSLQIANGMEFLANKMIIHRDLAARNILVDHNLDMKISDFGLTRHVANYYRKETDGLLLVKWMSPESLAEQIHTVLSDVWSFGILLWEVFTMGDTPYPTVSVSSLLQNLQNGLRNDKPAFATDELYQIMLSTWAYEPQDRPTFSELVDELCRSQ